MSVIIEAFSVIVRVASITEKYQGGAQAFINDLPNSTYCSDGALCRVGFMRTEDAHFYASEIMSKGLHSIALNDSNNDIAYASQSGGLVYGCGWILVREFVLNHHDDVVLCASLVGVEDRGLAVPEGWTYEQYKSLTLHHKSDILDLYKDLTSVSFEATIASISEKRYIGIPNFRKNNETLN